MDLIGQLQPNTPVKFVKVEMNQALATRKMRAELLVKVRASLAGSLPRRFEFERRGTNALKCSGGEGLA